MKPIHVKRVIQFIQQYHPIHNAEDLKVILQQNPERFIYLLNEAIEVSGSTPKCATRFIREFQSIKKENPTMNKPKITMRLVVWVKATWQKAVQFFSGKPQKVTIISAIGAVVAFIITRSPAAMSMLSKCGGLLNVAKDLTLQNVYLAGSFIQLFGNVVWNQVVAVKNFAVNKAAQAWRWTVGLFSSTHDSDESLYNAA